MATVNIQMAILSHLSDAQHLVRAFKYDEAELHVNFVKYLVIMYPNTDVYETEYKLGELWKTVENRMKED